MQTPTSSSDPSGLYGSVVTVIGAVLAVLTAFGVDLTPDQVEAILTLLVVSGPIVTAVLIRRRAWAPDSVRTAVEGAWEDGVHGNPPPTT